MNKDITNWVKSYQACQGTMAQRHVVPAVFQISLSKSRFHHIHIGLVGPLPPSRGNTYMFTIIDHLARWLEAVPMPDTCAAAFADVLLSRWIVIFGVPETTTTDRGSQFYAHLFQHLSEHLGFNRICTTACHSQANGMLERFHRHLKTALEAYANSTH